MECMDMTHSLVFQQEDRVFELNCVKRKTLLGSLLQTKSSNLALNLSLTSYHKDKRRTWKAEMIKKRVDWREMCRERTEDCLLASIGLRIEAFSQNSGFLYLYNFFKSSFLENNSNYQKYKSCGLSHGNSFCC